MKKSVADQLASSLGRRDEAPNITLAKRIILKQDQQAIDELHGLIRNAKRDIAYDAIKVVYEVGVVRADMIADHVAFYVELLARKDNRMVWGAMTALSAIALYDPRRLIPYLPDVLKAMDEGSVITRDHGIYILCSIATLSHNYPDMIVLLLEQVEKAPVNQMPMYAEKTAEVIQSQDVGQLTRIIHGRLDVMAIPSKAKRLEKLLKKLAAR